MSVANGLSIKEQVQKTPDNEICQARGRPYLVGLNGEVKRAVLFQPRCKSWGCPVCAKINRDLWAVRAFHGAEVLNATLSKPIFFLTLTSHEKLGAAASLKAWPSAWKTLRERARYATGGFQYLLVPEQHKDGRFHVHAIETAGLSERWWKDNARECGLGYMAEEDIARTPQGCSYYMVKYVTKSIEYPDWPRGFRRVRTSQGWPKLDKLPEVPGWQFTPLTEGRYMSAMVEELRDDGYSVEFLDHRQAWNYIQESAPE